MILKCSACEKKFVVPDQAITANGRLVQCGSCGNKWKQFPIRTEIKKPFINEKTENEKKIVKAKSPKPKKKRVKKSRELSLYSPEYLAKKHGIKLDNNPNNSSIKKQNKVSFGFYNSLIMFLVILIALSKGLHFFQDFIVQKFPVTEFYINYFFESISNMFEIWKNLISNY